MMRRPRRPATIASMFTTDQVPSAQSAAVLKSASRLCWSARASRTAALAWARAFVAGTLEFHLEDGLEHALGVGVAGRLVVDWGMTRGIVDF